MTTTDFTLDYNLYGKDGLPHLAIYKVIDGQTRTDKFYVNDNLTGYWVLALEHILSITSWEDIDLWFTEKEWVKLVAEIMTLDLTRTP